jgi:hypothetical protein
MTELSPNQRKMIQDALDSLPENWSSYLSEGWENSYTGTHYFTMEGVEKQLAEGSKVIFYARLTDKPELVAAQFPFEIAKLNLSPLPTVGDCGCS